MKKLIISTFCVAVFATGLFANSTTNALRSTVEPTNLPTLVGSFAQEDEHCENMSVSWCGDDGETYYASGNFCGATQKDLYDMIDSVMATCD